MIIGSLAMKYWYPDFNREPKDCDVIKNGYSGEINSDLRKEYLENPVLVEHYKNKLGYCPYFIGKEELLTLKASHLFWNYNWEKHMFDVQFLLKKGCKINVNLFYKLYDYWNVYHSKNKRSDLKMNSTEFFSNAIKFPYEHDYVHEVLAKHPLLFGVPTYTKVLIGEVEVSEDLFNELSFAEKCSLVTEEVMLMATERFAHMHYKRAYATMLKKFIISHAPLWEAIFIIENFIFLHKPPFNYIKFLKEQGLQF